MWKLLIKLSLVVANAALAASSESQLDKVSLHFAAKEYSLALQALTPLMKELMSDTSSGGSRLPSPEAIRDSIKTDPAGVSALIGQLRNELQRDERAAALKTSYALGLSLAALKNSLPVTTQLRSDQLQATAPAGTRLAIVQSSALLISTYKAGNLLEAQRLAEDVLRHAPAHPQTSRFVHNAHTVLGLIAWQRNDRELAVQHLRQSITELKPETSVKLGQPSFALAEALLAGGLRQPVLDFVDGAIGFPGWETAKEKLKTYRSGLVAGSRSSFAPDHFLLF